MISNISFKVGLLLFFFQFIIFKLHCRYVRNREIESLDPVEKMYSVRIKKTEIYVDEISENRDYLILLKTLGNGSKSNILAPLA